VLDADGEGVARRGAFDVERARQRISLLEVEVSERVTWLEALIAEGIRRLDYDGVTRCQACCGFMLRRVAENPT
jgi:hypothetical protein